MNAESLGLSCHAARHGNTRAPILPAPAPVGSAFSVEPARRESPAAGRQLANRDELPEGLRDLDGRIPPLGQLFGVPLMDERVVAAAIVVFRGLGDNDYFEVLFDDFSRTKRPRVAGFALAGEAARTGSGTRLDGALT